jgi:hypothetical protein
MLEFCFGLEPSSTFMRVILPALKGIHPARGGHDQRLEADADDPCIRASDLATFLDELLGLLTSIDTPGINARMGYRYPAGAARPLDDALLAVHGSRYLALHGNAHRESALRARLEKLRTP